MADLGNLYFDILFRDKTAEQRKKLKAEITKDLQAKLDVGFDKKKLVGDMKTLLQSEKFKINVVVIRPVPHKLSVPPCKPPG